MPAISMIGNSRMAARSRPTSLPAEARSLARTLRLLNSPALAMDSVVESLDRVPKSPEREIVKASLLETVESMREYQDDIPPKVAEHRLSLTMELAIQKAFSGNPTKGIDENDDDSSTHSLPPANRPSQPKKPPQTKNTTTLRTKSPAVVSDSSTVASTTSQEEDDSSLESLERTLNMRKFWALVLESLHLQVSSLTTTVWGRKKKYEIYRLSGVASLSGRDLDSLLTSFEDEFLSIFSGGRQEESTCRTYALIRDSTMYLQINIGKWYDLQDLRNRGPSGEKKKKPAKEFLAVISPDDDLIALTASRAPSKSAHVKCVLSALDAAFVKSGNRIPGTKPKQVGDWSGHEPHELLNAARATQTGRAVGRFARIASEDISNPLVEMHKVSTSSLLDRSCERKRLAMGAKHGRLVSQSAATVERQMDGAILTAANSNGLIVDSSATLHRSRKRARDEELGNEGDCPRVQRICWKWTGETTAASACWLSDDQLQERQSELPKSKFKCGLVIEGSNVMEGLRQMMAKGYATAPLPDFVRNAPTLGCSTITVSDGAFAATEDSFAAV